MRTTRRLVIFIIFFFILFASTVTVTFSCQVHLCYTEYKNLTSGYVLLQQQQQQRARSTSILRSLNSRQSVVKEYCRSLEAYSACMKGLSKSCRGALSYHAVIVHVKKWIDDYNCTGSVQKKEIRNSGGKNSLNLTLRQHSSSLLSSSLSEGRENRDYPWTGSSSVSNLPPPRVKTTTTTTTSKCKRCKKHRRTQSHEKNLLDSDESAFSSSSTISILSVPYYALTIIVIAVISV